MWDMFRYLTPFSGDSFIEFEQVNVSWEEVSNSVWNILTNYATLLTWIMYVNPCRPDPGRNLNLYFQTFCGASKSFKGLHKTFETPQRSEKIKMKVIQKTLYNSEVIETKRNAFKITIFSQFWYFWYFQSILLFFVHLKTHKKMQASTQMPVQFSKVLSTNLYLYEVSCL